MTTFSQMTINHDKKLTSFFNMPIKEVTPMRAKPDMVSFKTFVNRNEKLKRWTNSPT